ncbi:hypothetical protein V8E55_006763 [Tylopilus felleus]
MSSTRSRNKFCLSLDNSSSNTSSGTAHLNRWSEVVPPKTALTFAALWDPEEGMVTFSGAALLEPESSSGRSQHPNVFDDDCSQFVSFERDIDGGATPDENTATLATFQDVFKAFMRHTPWDSREHLNTKAGQSGPRGLQTRASSTFDGLDIYSHDVQIKPRRSMQLSCIDLLDMESSFRAPSAFGRLRLRSDLMLDSYRSESEGDANTGSRPPYLNSRFSTTTTSTSNYIDVTINAAQSVRISETFPIPKWTQPSECISPAGSWPFLPRRRRLLRKRRPFDGDGTTATTGTSSTPSTPRKVMPKPPTSPSSRSLFSSARVSSSSGALTVREGRRSRFPSPMGGLTSSAPTPPNSPSKSPRLKLRFSFLPKRKPRETSSDSEGWVCIEVTPIIRQRYIADIDED